VPRRSQYLRRGTYLNYLPSIENNDVVGDGIKQSQIVAHIHRCEIPVLDELGE
jgi:hypothetical protein